MVGPILVLDVVNNSVVCCEQGLVEIWRNRWGGWGCVTIWKVEGKLMEEGR